MFYFNKTDFEFNLPDPRWEEPNLLIPGKKPTGPVTIDWSHPLARGLVQAYLFRFNSFEYVDSATKSVSGTSQNRFVPEGWEQLWTGTTGGSYIDTGFPANTYSEGTIFTKYRPSSLYNYNSILDNTDLGNDFEGWIYSDGRVAFRRDGADTSAITSTGLVVSGVQYSFGFQWSRGSSTGNQVWLDGYQRATGNSLNVSISGTVNINGGNSSNTHGAGTYEVFYIYTRHLSSSEHLSLHRNPYQILCPQ